MAEITVEVPNAALIAGKLDKLRSSLLDWSTAMQLIGKAFTAYYSSVPFASRGSVYGTTWPDLNPSYESYKAKHFPGKPMLVQSGALMQGFEFVADKDSVRISNKVEYFEQHQFGQGVPQRIIMALNQEREDAAESIIRKELNKKVDAI